MFRRQQPHSLLNHVSRMIAAFVACLLLSSACADGKRPHIIFILADDMGWADTSLFGACQIPTPNLDALATTGALFSQYYSLPTCTPSRAAILTGLYPIRLGLQHDVLYVAEEGGMNTTVRTMAQHLRKLGYRTYAVGKWHLGYSNVAYTPTRRGFDSFFGVYNYGQYYFSPLTNFNTSCGVDLWENEVLAPDTDGVYRTQLFTDRAVDIIRHHDTEKPLFMYLAHTAAHGQTKNLTTDAPRRNLAKFPYIGDRNRTLLAGTIDALDESIGRLFSELHQRGMLSNSVVVFASDNGGSPWGPISNAGSNWPLRGSKGTIWEGGVRVPALVWSPLLRSRRGYPVSRLVHAVDWLPTLYSAAGGDAADLGTLDGLNLWPWLRDKKPRKWTLWPRNELLVNVDVLSAQSAYREGDYKLVSITNPAGKDASYLFGDPAFSQHIPTPGKSPPCGEATTAKDLDALMTSSLVWKTLQRFYSDSGGLKPLPSGWREVTALHCNPENSTLFGPEGPREGYYLFDLRQDPCEVNDLSSRLQSARHASCVPSADRAIQLQQQTKTSFELPPLCVCDVKAVETRLLLNDIRRCLAGCSGACGSRSRSQFVFHY
ncbi:arylsulfatase B-like isoform X3 [Amblyomma americanum]